MKGIIRRCFIVGVLAMCITSNVYATSENKIISKEVLKSEESDFITSLEQEVIEGENKYKLLNYSKEDKEDNVKNVTAYKTDIIKSNKKESIIEHFGDSLKYDDSVYSGTIPIKDYDIRTIHNGKYEVIDEKKISFSKYSKNDLDNIVKEKSINGTIYYLINVNWESDETEIIDNQSVPVNYKGEMIYQTVLQKNYPFDYEVTVSYEGNVTKNDPVYIYNVEYEKIEETVIIENNDYTIPTIIISGLGLALILLYFINSNTAKVYCKTEKGYKLIKVVRLSKKHNQININKVKHKSSTNMYAIKTSKKFYNKNKDMLIKVKMNNVTKNVYLNFAYIDFIFG